MTTTSAPTPFSIPSDNEAAQPAPRVRQTRIRPDDWEPPAGAQRGDGHAVWLGRFAPDSPEWHEARRTRLGGSEVAAVAGLSKWESAYSLFHRKLGSVPQKSEEELAGPAEWGTRLEDVVGGHFCSRHPELGLGPSGTFVHSERPWQLANPDLLGAGALAEVKTALYDYAWGPDGTDEVPIYYRAQVTHYMDVLGLDQAHLCVLIGGYDYREYVIPFDLADALYLRELGEAFMVRLRNGEEPELDGHWETKAAVEWLHPEIERVDVEVDPELADYYERALRLHKAAETMKVEATSRMIVAMGKARRAMRGKTSLASRVPGKGSSAPYLRVNPTLLAVKPTEEAATESATAHDGRFCVLCLSGEARHAAALATDRAVEPYREAVAQAVEEVAQAAEVPTEVLQGPAADGDLTDVGLGLGPRLQRAAEQAALERQRAAAAARQGTPSFGAPSGGLVPPPSPEKRLEAAVATLAADATPSLADQLAACTTRAEVVAVGRTLADPTPEQKAAVNKRWQEVGASA